MLEESLTDTVFIGSIIAVVLVWVIVSLYAFWRAGRMTDRSQSLQDLADFLDSMIKTDHRHPIWVWPDGKLQTDGGALSLIGIHRSLTTLNELAGEEGEGLPPEIIEHIKTGVEKGEQQQGPFVVEVAKNQTKLILDIQWLPSKDVRWPSCIVWIEESVENAMRVSKYGVRALEMRLKDLSRVQDNLPYPVWIRGIDDTLLDVNEAYVKAVDGKTKESTIDNKLELFGRGSHGAAKQASAKGQQVRERRFGVIDGQRRAFALTHSPLEAGGNVLSTAVDVTGEEEALSELSRVLESQSETLNRLRSPVAIFGPAQKLRFYNSAFARLTHISEDVLSTAIDHSELLDTMREKRRLPEQADFREWKENLLTHYTSLLEPLEEMWHLPDGTAHRVVTQPHPLGGLLILFEDVTDRLALERSYNTLIAVQQETLESMREGVAVFGTDGMLELSNPAFLKLWQLSESDISGNKHLSDIVSILETRSDIIEDDEDLISNLAALATERKPLTSRVVQRRGCVVDCALVPLPDGGVMLAQSDVTDSFKVEKALRERSSALEAADRLKSEFITSMSYELRTPLNSIIGFAELLDQRIFGEMNTQQSDYVKNILSAADGLKHLISSVLDLAVIDAGEVELELSDVNLVEAVEESATLAQELAHKIDISLMVDMPQKVPAITADGRRLKQAIYNMVSSMLSFARYGGVINISLKDEDETVTLFISNSESGLALKERERLISVVEMGSSPGGRRITGLDLALVRSIVTLHGGTINLERYDGEGLRLSCTLPRKQPTIIE